MTLSKFNKTSFNLALLIGLFCSFLFCLLAYFIFELPPIKFLQWGGVLFLGVGFFSYLLLSKRLEEFMLLRVKELYNSLFPSTISTSIIKSDEDIELLTRNLKKLNTDKNLEIEVLKNQENFRKEFIGNIAHELKTPLFTIQGYVLTLLDGGVTDQKILTKYLKRTSKGVERLTYIVKDLDLITKFESGMTELEIKPFDVVTTIKSVFELLEMQTVKNKITLRFDKKYSEPIYVMADEERIQQVISNLIINSLKYGVDRGITEVSIDNLKEDKVLIRIADNGEGIDKQHLPRLFERFYRVEKTRNRKLGGSGLGLAIVKHIIDAHNEKIFVESEVNVGSEFSFSLTRAAANDLKGH